MNGKWLRGALIVTRARIIEIGVDRPKQSTRTHAGSDKDAISKKRKRHKSMEVKRGEE
jgi:hypothetical protein